MQDLRQRELKIQEKRKQTPFRDFVKEIGSWMSANIYKHPVGLSRYPNTDRCGALIEVKAYQESGWNKMCTDGVDLTQSFFSQLSKFYLAHPKSSLNQVGKNENSDYADSLFTVKDAYLSFATGDDSENILYSFAAYAFVRNVLNCVFVTGHCDNIFFCTDVTKSFNIFYSKFINNSTNLRFCSNMTGCSECLFCDGLTNASYAIHNKVLPKDEYAREKKKILAQKHEFSKFYDEVNKHGENSGSRNVQGQRVIFSENIENGFLCSYMKDCRNVFQTAGIDLCTNFYDCIEAGFDSHDLYGIIQAGTHASNLYCSNSINQSTNIYYSFHLDACSYCLGCIGLKNKSFCIFNKEYGKDERFELANKIFEKMDTDGTLGKFFPASMNPFYFNDTAAYLIDDSFTKEEVTEEGYLRRDEEIKVDVPEGAEVVFSYSPNPSKIEGNNKPSAILEEGKGGVTLSDFQGFDEKGVWKIDPEILKKVIKDEKGNYYRIVKMEYDFLMKHGLPLPELHRLERIKLGFKFK